MSRVFNRDVIVIVGGFSSGHYIAPLFNGLGFSSVHVCTEDVKEHPLMKPTFNAADYVENYVLGSEDDVGDFVQAMRGRRIKAVITGCEPCVPLGDRLSELLEVRRNVGALRSARRSKYLMHETLRKNGLKSARQLLTDNLQSIFDFHEAIGAQVVLKPDASANTDGVFYCNTRAQIVKAAHCILGVKNFLGHLNTTVLVQEYLTGKQYLLNTLSSDGHHHVCDAWGEVRHDDEAPSNDSHADMVFSGTEVYRALAGYATRVIDALGIRFGAAHLEMRMTDEGPCLVEMAARMSGNVDFSVLHCIDSMTQLSLLPDALLDPPSFLRRVRGARPGTASARKVYLASTMEGVVLQEPDLSLFFEIDSVTSVRFLLAKGDTLYKTNRAQGRARPGYLYMVSNDPDELERDYARVRRNEQRLYETMLAPDVEARQDQPMPHHSSNACP